MAADLYIAGASGHARVVADIAARSGRAVAGFVVDQPRAASFLGRPLSALSAFLAAPPAGAEAVVAIGDPRARGRVAGMMRAAGVPLATLVHPAAVVAEGVRLGAGTVVMAGAVVNPGGEIGEDAIVNTGAIVDHDARLADLVHVCPGATLAGDVSAGEAAWIGIGACAIQGVHIGAWAMVGAGAVVVRDIPDEAVAWGNPARVRRKGPHF